MMFRPSARPRSEGGKAAVTSAVEVAASIAPPPPCTARQASIHASLGLSAAISDASANTTRPIRKTRRRPHWSAIRPAGTSTSA